MALSTKGLALDWLWRRVIDREIVINIHRSALSDIAAWSMQSSSPHGKCVVVPDQE